MWQPLTADGQYDFLLHSMLALGASHLSLVSPSGYEKAALKHRVTAIKTLNEHLSKPNLSIPEADAAFGAMLNLTFQAAYMADGLVDFLTMIRGCTKSFTHHLSETETYLLGRFPHRQPYIIEPGEFHFSNLCAGCLYRQASGCCA